MCFWRYQKWGVICLWMPNSCKLFLVSGPYKKSWGNKECQTWGCVNFVQLHSCTHAWGAVKADPPWLGGQSRFHHTIMQWNCKYPCVECNGLIVPWCCYLYATETADILPNKKCSLISSYSNWNPPHDFGHLAELYKWLNLLHAWTWQGNLKCMVVDPTHGGLQGKNRLILGRESGIVSQFDLRTSQHMNWVRESSSTYPPFWWTHAFNHFQHFLYEFICFV